MNKGSHGFHLRSLLQSSTGLYFEGLGLCALCPNSVTQSLRVLFCCEQFLEPVDFSRILKYRIVVDFEVGQIAPQAPDGHRSTHPTSNDRRRRFRMGVPPSGHCGAIAPTFRAFDPRIELLNSEFSNSGFRIRSQISNFKFQTGTVWTSLVTAQFLVGVSIESPPSTGQLFPFG